MNKISARVLAGSLLGSALALGLAGSAHAASDTKTVNVTVNVNAMAKLTLSGAAATAITFANADPTTTPLVTQTEAPVNVLAQARASAGSEVALTVSAPDLADSSQPGVTIGIQNIEFESTVKDPADPSGPATGAVTTAGVTLGTRTGSGEMTGTVVYRFKNLLSHPVGQFTTTLTYTLTAN